MSWLAPNPNKIYVDGTLGRGGHARAILEKTGPGGRLFGFDRDPEAVREAGKVLAEFGDRVVIIRDNFRNIAKQLADKNCDQVHGILLDLGVSSPQLEDPERGFSFRFEGPLDMRMDPQSPVGAEEIVNEYPERELLNILWQFGEERFARRIVRRILEERRHERIRTTFRLASIVSGAVPAHYRYGRIHPATRTFQALRIAVNREIESLEEFLSSVTGILAEGGRLVIISFHSLEDRLVKNAFRGFSRDGLGALLTKKPVTATDEERARNPRSRSAKLRAFQKNSMGTR